MKKGEVYCGKVSSVLFPKKGRVEVADTTVMVEGVYLEQEVEFRIVKKKLNRVDGKLISVIKKADYEIEPNCSFFDVCGGCSFANLPYEMELSMKEDYVKGLLEDSFYKWQGIENTLWEDNYRGITGAVSTGAYRNKMEFTFGDAVKGGELELGLHKRYSSHDIITVRDCDIVDEDFKNILLTTLDFARRNHLTHYHRMKHEGELRHLLVRKGYFTGEIMVGIVTTSVSGMDYENWKNELLGLNLQGTVVSVCHIVNDSLSDAIKADSLTLLHGRDYIYDRLFDLTFKISVFSFFQTNTAMAEKLYSKVLDFAGDTSGQVVLDLYCGTGTIAQILAKRSKRVLGIELVEEAVVAARENAKLNHLDNCEFIAGDVGEITKELNRLREEKDYKKEDCSGGCSPEEEKPPFISETMLQELSNVETIIVDPPREGLRPNALPQILSFQAPNIVYVSCKASSLARDIIGFLEAGYEVKRIEVVDMFARTANVETVALLSKLDVDKHISVKIELHELLI